MKKQQPIRFDDGWAAVVSLNDRFEVMNDYALSRSMSCSPAFLVLTLVMI